MSDDEMFRWALVAVFAVAAPYALTKRFQSVTPEKLDRWQEGAFILFGLRLSAFPVFIGGLVWMISPAAMTWSSMPLAVPARWLGIALAALSAALLVWTFANLGANLTDTVVTRREHTLVTTGPYRYVRHPFYLTGAIGLFGGALAMANWFILVAGLFPLGFLIARTRIEEEKLIERFGTEYREYMTKTGRFLPRRLR